MCSVEMEYFVRYGFDINSPFNFVIFLHELNVSFSKLIKNNYKISFKIDDMFLIIPTDEIIISQPNS